MTPPADETARWNPPALPGIVVLAPALAALTWVVLSRDAGPVALVLLAVVVAAGAATPRARRAGQAGDRRFRRAFERTPTAAALLAADGTFVDANDAMARLAGLPRAGDGIVRIDAAGRIVYANPAAGRLLGHGAGELTGADAHALMQHTRGDGSPYPVASSPIRAAAQRGEVSRVTDEVFWRKDGSSFAVDYTSAPIRDDGRVTGAVCVFADISGRVAHELEARQQDRWRARIEQARRTDQFLVYSQPILDLAGGRVVQEELLIRMRGATADEVLPPGQFLPDAERHGLMASIDQWMIGQALRMAARGRRVAVNISAQSLGRPELVGEIAAGLRESGADARAVTFEITETAAVHQIEAAQDFAVALTDLGCRIALDDFGTGFGSFSYLKSFPAAFLKIDIEFVRDLVHSESDQRIVQTIVRMARDFGQQTIAEGVEDAPTLELLRAYGVDYAQGYFIGRPLPAERGII